ncbi:protein GRAVITROPIC IN THE LIGHT 1-like [Aristolochia californica]|uniref:protein GRAVITROPIC IN THE LIGHT 1-like n=1 Tax=Aristolochia californica TaxID=171875 RepID=UPI0035DD7F7B
MVEMEGSVKTPQISEMFQKFALAFKTKTSEFFAEEDEAAAPAGGAEEDDPIDLSLLDFSEEIITGQRVVVIKPDQPEKLQTLQTLVSLLFATVSSFNASYLHLQTAHAPFDAESIQAADRTAVSHLQRLSQLKHFYQNYLKNPDCPNPNIPLVSHLEAQVRENQSLLRTFGMMVDCSQSEIDRRDAEVSTLRQQLEKLEADNWRLERSLDCFDSSSPELLLSIGLFRSVLQDVCRSTHSFTKLLIDLIKNVGWDLDLAAKSFYPGIEYAKKGHSRYAFLSYVCLGMFGSFSSENFGLEGNEKSASEQVNHGSRRRKFLLQFVEHGSVDALELLEANPDCDFAQFCEKKYRQLIRSNMESSLLGNLVEDMSLDSWRSSGSFYEAFVNMASMVWMLHKLAFSFDPTVGIFQVEKGVDFSMVYMENIVRRSAPANSASGKTRAKVGFTVIPGFKVGKTVIQSQVYLTGLIQRRQSDSLSVMWLL